MLKRAGSGLLSQWKLKYLILLNTGTLQILDQCGQSAPPKHQIRIEDCQIEVITGSGGISSGLIATGPIKLGKKAVNPFIIYSRQRKFYFAAQTLGDGEDWLNLLLPLSQRSKPLKRAGTLLDIRRGNSLSAPQRGGAPILRSRSMRFNDEEEDGVDSQSGGDFDDCASVVSSLAPSIMEAEEMRSSTSFETLSFCSEPVLTPYELQTMGANTPQNFKDDTTKRRKAPMALLHKSGQENSAADQWNSRYQALLCHNMKTEDEMLRIDIELVTIIGLFEEAALSHATKMVDEYHLKKSDKNSGRNGSNVPGAVAVDGIILHFVCDYDVASEEEVDAAVARTSSELRSIDAVNQTRGGLHTALMVLIDYKGFRIQAYADMGIDSKTVPVWDLNTRPIHVDEKITEKLIRVGHGLNLKQHGVQIGDDRRVNTPLSASAEVHHHRESQFDYVLNLFEIFPMDFHPPQRTPSSSPSRSKPPSPVRGGSIHSSKQQLSKNTTLAHQQTQTSPCPSRRLRPEFLAAYSSAICADVFTPAAGCGRVERETNDAEAERASRFLRENWIPAFVRKLDELEVRPADSREFSRELHRHGVNIRHLGLIASLSKIPYTRDLCCVEMTARAAKVIFNARLRALIIHFRSVGATQIDEEMNSWVSNTFSVFLGSGDKSEKFFEEKLKPEIMDKFDYSMDYVQFCQLHKPALFLAMQYQCGVVFEDTMDYDFNSSAPCHRSKLVGFTSKKKLLSGLPRMIAARASTGPKSISINSSSSSTSSVSDAALPPPVPEDERLAYHLTRHFKSLGPKSKLSRSDASGLRLIEVAAHYNATGRHEEAKKYATAAISAAERNTCVSGLARAQIVEAMGYSSTQIGSLSAPDATVLSAYRSGVAVVEWHWGATHPIGMALHDRMSAVYIKARKYEQALEFHNISLELAMAALGKNHAVTAGYQAKAAVLQSQLRQTDEAIRNLSEALHTYEILSASPTLISEVHSHLADAYSSRGDFDAAISSAQMARRLRERALGQMDPRSVSSCLQVASFLMKPYESYEGVLTPVIRKAYSDAIICYEKVFRYVKTHLVANSASGGRDGSWSSSGSSLAGSGGGGSVVGGGAFSSSGSSVSGTMWRATGSTLSVPVGEGWPSFTPARATPVSGPAVSPPFAPMPPLPKSILHKLTRRIVGLKIALLEKPSHRKLIRTLRNSMQVSPGGGDNGGCGGDSRLSVGREAAGSCDGAAGAGGIDRVPFAFDPTLARDVIVRMAAVSPSIYLDGIISRIDDEDESAVEELAIALFISEKDTLKLAA